MTNGLRRRALSVSLDPGRLGRVQVQDHSPWVVHTKPGVTLTVLKSSNAQELACIRVPSGRILKIITLAPSSP